jgi:two-component system cell cycle response regulator DivK
MANPPVTIKQARFLIVEDDENNRIIAAKLLQLEGVPAANIFAVEGDPLPFLQNLTQPVNLILLDLQLPGKDGYKVLRELKSSPQFAHTPTIAMTANVMKKDIERIRAAGFDGFIGKPINARRFGEWINHTLAGKGVWPAA